MRSLLVLIASTLLPLNLAVSQDNTTRPTDKQAITSHSLDNIAESLQQIRLQLATLSSQINLQLNVGALATLDTDISTLSTELQWSLEAKLPLESTLARLRATVASRELAATERAELTASQDSLDQLTRRIEELRRSIASRQTLLADLEKTIKSRPGGEHK